MITVREMVLVATKVWDYTERQLVGAQKHRPVARRRQVIAYFASRETSYSLPQIGRALGGRDHTTIMHAVKTIEAGIRDVDPLITHLVAEYKPAFLALKSLRERACPPCLDMSKVCPPCVARIKPERLIAPPMTSFLPQIVRTSPQPTAEARPVRLPLQRAQALPAHSVIDEKTMQRMARAGR